MAKTKLTCPVIFKTVEEMEDHHNQSMERDECNVHLGTKERKKNGEDKMEAHSPHTLTKHTVLFDVLHHKSNYY